MNAIELAETFVIVVLASAGINYTLRTSAYCDELRDWWWRRAPQAVWAMPRDVRPGRVWPFPVSRSWQLVFATEKGTPVWLDPVLHEAAVAPAVTTEPTVWYSKDGIMLGRVLTCRLCFGFWTTVLPSFVLLWPRPGGWDLRSLLATLMVVFAAWPVAVMANVVLEKWGVLET